METIRVSLGTAASLGLKAIKVSSPFYTAYLLTPIPCKAKCMYCAQAYGISDKLSRVFWPEYPLEDVIYRLKLKKPKRICLQATYGTSSYAFIEKVLPELVKISQVSVSYFPRNQNEIRKIKELGADYIGISIDVASQPLFEKFRKYDAITWENTFKFLKIASNIFGEWHVISHVIVGLGETDFEVISLLQRLVEMKVLPSLMAFTPIKGTPLENFQPPDYKRYRAIQVSLSLILKGKRFSENLFDDKGRLLKFPMKNEEIYRILKGNTFTVIGCPWCNRPYYNEKPSKPYNFPTPPDTISEYIKEALQYVESNNRQKA